MNTYNMTSLKANRIAVFVDAENVTGWIKNGGVAALIDELKQLGQIIIRRAYGVWSRPQLAMHQAAINQQGFELIHCYHPVTGKNTADIQMTVDVIECAWQLPNINCFVLVTGDSDFSPVFRRLREMEKEVIGVGQHSTLSECVKTSCSRFIFTDVYVENSQPLLQTKSTANLMSSAISVNQSAPNTASELNAANRLVIQLLEKSKEAINTSLLKNTLKAQLNFDEKKFNYDSFSAFLSSITGVKLTKTGTVNYAAFDGSHKNNKSNETKPVDSVQYLSALKKRNLRLISEDRIKIIYKHAATTKDIFSDMTSLKESVFAASHEVDGQLLKADVNKAFNLFIRLDLVHTEKEIGGIDVIKIKKIVLKDFLLKIDKLIISTLIEQSKISSFQLNAKEIKKITMSTISKDAIKNLIGET